MRLKGVGRVVRVDLALWAAIGVFLGGAVLSAAAPLLVGDPLLQRLDQSLLRPGEGGFLFGTDHLGRDVLSRILHGGRSSYAVALGSAAVAGSVGTSLGLLAGLRNWPVLDRLLMILSDALLAFPTVMLAIAVALVLGPGRLQVMWTLGIVYVPVVYRVARIETRRTVLRDFYRVSLMLGTPAMDRAVLHLLPSVLPQVLVQMASLAALAVGTEAALSFLGLGTQPPTPSWGLMLSDARRYLVQAPYLSILPGCAAAGLTASLQLGSDRVARRIAA